MCGCNPYFWDPRFSASLRSTGNVAHMEHGTQPTNGNRRGIQTAAHCYRFVRSLASHQAQLLRPLQHCRRFLTRPVTSQHVRSVAHHNTSNISVAVYKYFINAPSYRRKNGYEPPNRPPLWSSGQSSWLQTQKFRVQFRELQDFLVAEDLQRGPLSLVRINEELLEREVAAPI
jgi:hypothetical protein